MTGYYKQLSLKTFLVTKWLETKFAKTLPRFYSWHPISYSPAPLYCYLFSHCHSEEENKVGYPISIKQKQNNISRLQSELKVPPETGRGTQEESMLATGLRLRTISGKKLFMTLSRLLPLTMTLPQ